jgi:uncharacterized protein with HEPN domain
VNTNERAIHYLNAFEENLLHCSQLSAFSLEEFVGDNLKVLAAEALAIRAGELVKRLARLYPDVFSGNPWRLIAQHRDKVAHDYLDLDVEALFLTITRDFLELRPSIANARQQISAMSLSDSE